MSAPIPAHLAQHGEEEWRPVPGWVGRYEVSTLGRVRSLVVGRELRPNRWQGYCRVLLGWHRRQFRASVHSLALTSFVGPRAPGMEARHLNGDPTDNRLVNLAWGTRAENDADRERHGGVLRGERNPTAKLTEAAVREIRASTDNGAALARRFGVSKSAICDVRRGRRWAHLSLAPTEHALDDIRACAAGEVSP